MISKIFILENETGMHARPASELAKLASNFKSDIKLVIEGKEINAKSVLGIMSAGIKKGTQIEIVADGEDEKEAIQKIDELFKRNFGE